MDLLIFPWRVWVGAALEAISHAEDAGAGMELEATELEEITLAEDLGVELEGTTLAEDLGTEPEALVLAERLSASLEGNSHAEDAGAGTDLEGTELGAKDAAFEVIPHAVFKDLVEEFEIISHPALEAISLAEDLDEFEAISHAEFEDLDEEFQAMGETSTMPIENPGTMRIAGPGTLRIDGLFAAGSRRDESLPSSLSLPLSTLSFSLSSPPSPDELPGHGRSGP